MHTDILKIRALFEKALKLDYFKNNVEYILTDNFKKIYFVFTLVLTFHVIN